MDSVCTIKEKLEVCPLCGAEMQNIYQTDNNELVVKDEVTGELEQVFLTDIGVFKFIPDEEHEEYLHVDWHHQH